MFPWQRYSNPPKVHFIGVGGTGMVAGARLALEAGWELHGSDNPLYPPASDMVAELDIAFHEGYQASSLDWDPDLVVVGNALSRGNPEVEETLKRGIPYTSLAEFVKEVVLRQRRPVVVTGTHGKTTTTAITAHLLRGCGLDPGWLVGGQPISLPGPSRLGPEGAPFVIEGDEYDTAFFDKRAKFFHYLPHIAIVTSIEFDHADIYSSVEEIELQFRRMLRQIPPQGTLLVNSDDRRAAALAEDAPCRVQSYGFGPEAHWRGELTGYSAGFAGLLVHRGGRRFAELAVPLAGRHNHGNTLAAVAAASLLGAGGEEIQRSLMEFGGIRRRMEVFHEAGGVAFVDDFAHHPTAIRATLQAARERWPQTRLLTLLEPRSNTMVRSSHQGELAGALGGADAVWIGPVHRGERVPAEERLDRSAVTEELTSAGVPASIHDDVEELARSVLGKVRRGDVVLILSNGSFGGIYDIFRRDTAAF